jgi:hypothetical protein
MSDYNFIDTDDDFKSCVISIEFDEIKKEPNDSDMILKKNGIVNTYLTTNKGHHCIIPIWENKYTFHSKYMNYVMKITFSNKLIKYETVVDGNIIKIVKELNDNVFNVVLSVNENISTRKMPSYKGFFKGFIMKTNPSFTKSYASSKNILFENVFQMWKTGSNKYSLDYHYSNQQFHISDTIAFAIATTMFHSNE